MRQLTDEEDKILEELSNGNLSEEERTKRVKRLKEIDKDFLYQTVNRKQFKENFFSNAKNDEIKEYIKEILK